MLDFFNEFRKKKPRKLKSKHNRYIFANKSCLKEYNKVINENDAYYGC